MTEKDQSDSTLRRTFMKGAAATGVAATGLTAFSGSAAAQQHRTLRLGDVQAVDQDGLVNLNIQVQNVDVLRDLDIDEIVITVIGGDVRILEEVDVNIEDVLIFEDRVINIEDVDVDILNESLVQVGVAILSDQELIATGSTTDIV